MSNIKNLFKFKHSLKDGENGFKQLIFDADGLRKIMTENVKVSERFQKNIFETAAKTTSFQSVSSAVQQLNGLMQNLTVESLDFGKAMKAATSSPTASTRSFRTACPKTTGLASWKRRHAAPWAACCRPWREGRHQKPQ